MTGPALAGLLIGVTLSATAALVVAAMGQLLFVSQLLRLPEVPVLETAREPGLQQRVRRVPLRAR